VPKEFPFLHFRKGRDYSGGDRKRMRELLTGDLIRLDIYKDLIIFQIVDM